MKVKIYNQIGEEVGTHLLPKDVFEVKTNPDLVNQVVVCQESNRRQGNAQTKDRSEVRGGGKKPWRQKGTGRARHGSNRSPLWKGGGVTFGPRNERNYKKIVTKQIRLKAVLMVLSSKAQGKFLIVLEGLEFKEFKTKLASQVLKSLPMERGSKLIVLPEHDKNLVLAFRNIPSVGVVAASDMNALDLMSFKYVVMLKPAIKVIEKAFVK